MRKEQQSRDLFQNDQFSISKSLDARSSHFSEQFPFKIGSNFIQEDSEGFISDTHNMSFDDLINQRIAKQLNSRDDFSESYTQQQIIKINKLNEKIRLMIAFENQFNQQIKRKQKKINEDKELMKTFSKDFLQYTKEKSKIFRTQMSEIKIQPVKINRIAKIPPQKRICYLNNKDKNEVKKRKYIQVFLSEKDLQLRIKMGLINPFKNESIMDQRTKQTQNYIRQYASQIDSDIMRTSINKNVHDQLSCLGQQLKKTIKQHKQTIQYLNQQVSKLVVTQANAQQVVIQHNLVREMELERKIVNGSETLLEIVPSKSLFSFMPNFTRQNLLNLQNM